jgi:uncharacterized membrane protein
VTIRLPGISERSRAGVCFLAGGVSGAVIATLVEWELGVLCGWLATSLVFVAWVWYDVGALDAGATAAVATREDDSRAAARLLLVGASVASLVAVGFGLRRAAQVGGARELALTASSLAAVVAAWTVVHTVFVLRYAHLYYGGDDVGGVDFPGGSDPAYRDFAYLGFTVGMTFQVSDTSVTTSTMRAAVLRHALVSYLFGAAVIAATINVLASFVGR